MQDAEQHEGYALSKEIRSCRNLPINLGGGRKWIKWHDFSKRTWGNLHF